MKYLLFIIFIFSTGQSVAAEQLFTSSERPAQLIELYTSEGCSSCPPADAWMSRLKTQENLWSEFVPIAFHVDYWDWIGWKDRFADPSHASRQRQHKRTGQLKSVYTPGFLVAGEEWRGFFQRRALPKNLQGVAPLLSLKVTDDIFELSFSGEASAVGQAHIALLGMNLKTPVKKGENAGRELEHDFVVLDWQTLEGDQLRWQGKLNKESWRNDTNEFAVAAWVEQSKTSIPLQTLGGYLK